MPSLSEKQKRILPFLAGGFLLAVIGVQLFIIDKYSGWRVPILVAGTVSFAGSLFLWGREENQKKELVAQKDFYVPISIHLGFILAAIVLVMYYLGGASRFVLYMFGPYPLIVAAALLLSGAISWRVGPEHPTAHKVVKRIAMILGAALLVLFIFGSILLS